MRSTTGSCGIFPADYYLDKKQGRVLAEKDRSGRKAGGRDQAGNRKADRDNEPEALRVARKQHETALRRIQEIKNELKALEREEKELETETYIKSRVLNTSFSGRGPEERAECGRRLKEIQSRLRDIASLRKRLNEEREKIDPGGL